jgi:hypothetical protein
MRFPGLAAALGALVLAATARAAVVDFETPERLPAVGVEDSARVFRLYQDAGISALLRVAPRKRPPARLTFGSGTVVVCARDKGCAAPEAGWSWTRPHRGDLFVRAAGGGALDRGVRGAETQELLVQIPPSASPYRAAPDSGASRDGADAASLARAAQFRGRLAREGGEFGRAVVADDAGVVVELLRFTRPADVANPGATAAVFFPVDGSATVDGAGLGNSRIFVAAPGATLHVALGSRFVDALLIYGRPASP